MIKMYMLSFVGGTSRKVECKEVNGNIRVNKNHPRLFLTDFAKRPCIGFEFLNKLLFIKEDDALKEMHRLNNEIKIGQQEWAKYVEDIGRRENWLTKEQFEQVKKNYPI